MARLEHLRRWGHPEFLGSFLVGRVTREFYTRWCGRANKLQRSRLLQVYEVVRREQRATPPRMRSGPLLFVNSERGLESCEPDPGESSDPVEMRFLYRAFKKLSCHLLVRGSAPPRPSAYHMSVGLRLCQRPVNDRKQLFTFERLHHMPTGTLLKPPELVTLLSLR